jgi:glucan phosphoethanolaminetransferase (alkaline phosphatase superfamily)
MELDELKDIWKKNDADFRPRGEKELASMIKGNSKSIIDKLKRSVWFELIFTLISGIILLIYALTLPSGALKWTSVSILAIFVGYSFYYVKKLSLLMKFGRVEDNLKVNLETLIHNLNSYLKFYKRSYTILYPVYFILALIFGAIERGVDEFLNVLSQPRTIIYLVALAGIFYFCSTWLVNWFLKKLYGNHLERLKKVLSDLNVSMS